MVHGFEDGPGTALQQNAGHAAAQFTGLGAVPGCGVADHGSAIGGEDAAGEEEFGVLQAGKGTNRDLAAATEFGEEGSLSGYGEVDPRVVQQTGRIKTRPGFQSLDGECPLADSGKHHVGAETLGDDISPAETTDAGSGEHNGIILTFLHFGDSGVDIAADVAEIEIGAEAGELRDAPERAGADDGTRAQKPELAADDGVEGVGPFGDGSDYEAFGKLGGEVLQAVNREVNATVEQGVFNFFGEQALTAHFGKRDVKDLVSTGVDDFNRAGQASTFEFGLDMIRLPERELRAARADNQHGFSVAGWILPWRRDKLLGAVKGRSPLIEIRAILLAGLLGCGVGVAQTLPAIQANENRVAAGTLSSGVLTLTLELRKGDWHPEKEDGEAIPVYALAEAGKPLQVPSPMIRVPQGTTIDITLRSSLAVPTTLHGLHQRPGTDKDVVTVGPGATQHVRFVAGKPGTYLYWGRTPDGQRGANRGLDSMLGGALVVDKPGETVKDRVFVLERWNGPTRTAMNGKSWPYTERLNYEVGEKVKWRLVNASDLSHPMHLHGFSFELDAEGDGENSRVYEDGSQPVEFTHNVEVMETFDMTWVPKEPGRWLYHCHRIPHMRLPVPLEASDLSSPGSNHDHDHMHAMDSDYSGMGGMIMGLTVTGKSVIDTQNGWKPTRRLELGVGTRKGDSRFYELWLRDKNATGADAKPKMSTGLTGPVLVVTEGEQTEITVVNEMKEATAIHWHGIELESYYDGVPWWGGRDEKRAPAVEAGKTFTVRMIPPRVGTFMYHTHWHDAAQLTGGIHGTMIVLPKGVKYDAATDKSFLFSQSPGEPFGAAMILMNGSPQPTTLRLQTGVAYRLRFVNITPSVNNLRVQLLKDGAPVQWRAIAKDAAAVAGSPMKTADQAVAVGETFDFEYKADGPGTVSLVGWNSGDNRRAVQTVVFGPAN